MSFDGSLTDRQFNAFLMKYRYIIQLFNV